ncbi:MAG: 1-deoxy-D-xylulose-5-phosphate reductoisomerase, partial [Porphyromonadaceae bacterium]|nr:1-deoxy-D-xylulose-5-phosphate reductoisomerase [Porphyromonadaceae bacterium]
YKTLTFEHPDTVKFPLLGYAYEALRQGGNMPCIMSAANEVVVNAFLHDHIAFTDMPRLIAKAMERVPFIASPTYDDYVATDTEARQLTQEWI